MGDFAHEGEPESRAPGIVGAGKRIETVEDLVPGEIGDAGAGIGYGEDDEAVTEG